MKTIVPLAVLMSLIWLGCTEEVFVNVPGPRDTVYLPGEKIIDTRTVYITDSVVRVDTLVEFQIVYEKDTLVIRSYHFGDTLYIQPGRGLHSIPDELQPMVDEFFIRAAQKGYNVPGGLIYIEIKNISPNRQAMSFNGYAQLNIVINGNQTYDEMFLPLWRELAYHQLNKDYSQDPDSVMYPFYPSNKIRWSNRGEFKEKLDQIFN